MPDREKLIAVCQEWVIKLGEGCPTDTVCYHNGSLSRILAERWPTRAWMMPARRRRSQGCKRQLPPQIEQYWY